MNNKTFEVYLRQCKRCDAFFHTYAKHSQICPKCFGGKHAHKIFGELNKENVKKCYVCGKLCVCDNKPIIPFCSPECKDYCKEELKLIEDALNQEHEALCDGGVA